MAESEPRGPRPLIAVTTSELRPAHSLTATPEGEPVGAEMALGLPYLDAVERAGGVPVVVPPLSLSAIDALLGSVAAVCLSGGPDLDPLTYGHRRHARLGPTWRHLDRFELALAEAALERRLPVLAICRGMQVLNVARGGTLHQHLPDVVGAGVRHRQHECGERPTHWVQLDDDSRLRRILGCRRTRVNSFHHQAVDRLGERLVVTARATDGTIEAVEASDRSFVIGVQWHAECLVRRRRQAALFGALVEAAAAYRAGEAGHLAVAA